MYLFLLYFYFLWLAVQNLVLPWLYQQRLLSGSAVGVLMAGKEIILVLALLLLAYRIFRKDLRLEAPDYFALAYTLLLTAYLFLGPSLLGATAPFALRMISLRGLVMLALFYFWGRLSLLTIRELHRFIAYLIGLQFAVAAFGLFEWLFLPTSFWSGTVGAGTFMLDVKGLLEGRNVVNGLPSNMFQFGIRRLISTYGDPLAMGIASVFPLLICVAWLARGRTAIPAHNYRIHLWTSIAVIGAALLLTIGRESIGTAVLGVVLLLWWSGKLSRMAIIVFGLALAMLLAPKIWSDAAATLTFREGSAATHLSLLESSWKKLPEMVWGMGLGEAGGWAFSLGGVDSGIGESSYFDLMAQTGMLSAVLLIGFLLSSAKLGLEHCRRLGDPLIASAFAAAAAHIVARSLLAVFSPSLFAVIPLASFFFFCGAGFTVMQRLQLRPTLVARRVLVLKQAVTIPKRSNVSAY
jgi:hypothetical protein